MTLPLIDLTLQYSQFGRARCIQVALGAGGIIQAGFADSRERAPEQPRDPTSSEVDQPLSWLLVANRSSGITFVDPIQPGAVTRDQVGVLCIFPIASFPSSKLVEILARSTSVLANTDLNHS